MTTPLPTEPQGEGGLLAAVSAALEPRLQLVRRIGLGGMGEVFLARDPALRRSVAVKVLAPALAQDPEARARFEREAQAVAGLSHPNVLAVYSVGELADGTPYFVMPFVAGHSMAARIETEGPMKLTDARRVLGEVASALAAAHAKGIVHRDIKPANILFDEESGRALVADFGIAAVQGPNAGSSVRLTQTGMSLGTPQYMSPEQITGESATDRADVYALGLLAYDMLTGRSTFEATTPHELVASHLRDIPTPLAQLRDDVDPELSALIARCLEKDPAKRPSAAEVAQRLKPGGEALLEWPPPGLEELRGSLDVVAVDAARGTFLLLLAAVVALLGGPTLGNFLSAGVAFLMSLTAITGALVLLRSVLRAWRLAGQLRRGIQLGFGWFTLIEVAGDRAGDGGQLIAGADRFAALAADLRQQLRLARVAAAALPLVGSLVAILALYAWTQWADNDSAGITAVALAPITLLLCTALGAVLRARERRLLPKRQLRRRQRAASEERSLATLWRDAFDRVRGEQALGGGPARFGLASLVGVTVIAVLAIVVIGTASMLTVSASVGPTVWGGIVPKFANTTSKYRMAQAMTPWLLPADSSIDPLEAGRSFAALHAGRPYNNEAFPLRPIPPLGTPPWNAPRPPGVFAGRSLLSMPHLHFNVIDSLGRRATREEMAWLETIARFEGWADVATVARAPAVDFVGGRFQLPFREDADIFSMPIPPFVATKDYAYANTARIRYFLEKNQPDSAVLAAREMLSFGMQMAESGTFLIETLIGVVVVGIARDQLVRTYRVLGRPEAGVIAEAWAEAEEREQIRSAGAVNVPMSRDIGALRASVISWALDSTFQPSARREFLVVLGYASCSNVREMLLGPGPDLQYAFNEFQSRYSRFPSDSAVFALSIDSPRQLARRARLMDSDVSVGEQLLFGATRSLGFLLRNPRISGCAHLASELD